MNLIRTSIIKNKNKLLFLSSLFLIGVVAGLIYYAMQNEGVKEVLKDSLELENNFTGHVNMLTSHLLILPCIIFLLLILIGLPISLFFLFYEGLSLGFSLTVITSIYHLKGFWLMTKYFFFFKLIYIGLLIIFNMKCLDCARNLIGLVIYKGEDRIRKNFNINFRKLIVFLIFILLWDVVIYLISPFIIQHLITF